jgi:hypothetical protein
MVYGLLDSSQKYSHQPIKDMENDEYVPEDIDPDQTKCRPQ